jgi:hypothetical protein
MQQSREFNDRLHGQACPYRHSYRATGFRPENTESLMRDHTGRACLYQTPRQKAENHQDFTETLTSSHTGRLARIKAVNRRQGILNG